MGKTPEEENPGEKKKKLEKLRSAAQRQKAKLYIVAACITLLVCGCRSNNKQPTQKRTCVHYTVFLILIQPDSIY